MYAKYKIINIFCLDINWKRYIRSPLDWAATDTNQCIMHYKQLKECGGKKVIFTAHEG